MKTRVIAILAFLALYFTAGAEPDFMKNADGRIAPPPGELPVSLQQAAWNSTPYAKWKNGPSSDPDYFPIGVWTQEPGDASKYRELGVNLYLGLWEGPTEAHLAALKKAGMKTICKQNEVGLKHIDDPTIIGWMHGDEPDNFKKNDEGNWVPKQKSDSIVADYHAIRQNDPTRPVLLNLGQGVANDHWKGGWAKEKDYRELVQGSDIVSYDIYPACSTRKEVTGRLELCALGIERLREWSEDRKTVWFITEVANTQTTQRRATPEEMRFEIWSSIIHGARGIVYFCHQWKPERDYALPLNDPIARQAVTTINRQITELAPVLNSPTILKDAVVVTGSDPSVPVALMQKNHGGAVYLFASAMAKDETTAVFRLNGIEQATVVEVLGEERTLRVENGTFTDTFNGYEVHLYRIKGKEVVPGFVVGLSAADYYTIGAYILLMIFVGFVCRKISGNISDYIRMGGKSTWWMAGLSVFMASFSAATFTGYAAQAYLGGWSFMWNYWLIALFFFIQAAIFAPLMRNTRAVTPLDAVRLRFGGTIQQIVLWIGLPGSFIWSGVFLWTLATFMATVFGLPMTPVILVVGIVLVFYSVAGGSWSVQITDNLQAFLLLPMVTVLAALSLYHIGGISGLFETIQAQGLTSDFALLKSTDHVYTSAAAKVKPMFYTVPWLVAMLLNQFMRAANMNTCHRYLSLKTGREAQKAALLAGSLTLLGAFIWGLPALVGRLAFSGAIEALPLKYPADGAYAVVAMKLLPAGVLGLVIVAMFSATMSSMDSNLTGTSGILTKNLYIPLVKRLGFKPLEGRKLLLLAKSINLLLGLWAVIAALLFARYGGGFGIFGAMQEILALVGIPLSTPFVVSLLMKKVPKWAPVAGLITGLAASITMKFHGAELLGHAPYWHEKVFIISGMALIPTICTRVFWFTASQSYRKMVDDFFRIIRTPVDMEKESGAAVDHSHLKTVGGLGLLMSAIIAPLFFVSKTISGFFAVFTIFGFITLISGFMYYKGRKAGSLTQEVDAKRINDGQETDIS